MSGTLNTLFAVLAEKKILSEEEAKALAKKVSAATLPSDYGTAATQVKKFLKTIAEDL